MAQPRIRYTISFPRPSNHMVDVRMEVSGIEGPVVDLILPSWIPGSYKIRDYCRHVQEFGGERFRKVAKDLWRVETGRRKSLRVTYRVYCFELTVRSSHVDSDHAYLNPISLLMYVQHRKDEPHWVRIRAPRGWKVATGLPRRQGGWVAEDYDHLVDSPIEVSKFERKAFQVRGRRHEFVMHGPGNYDMKGLVRDTRKIVNEAARLFGGLPYRRYVFLMHAADAGSGGLEHRESCSMQVPRTSFKPQERYRRVLGLIAHEFFHVWNVKRILPAAFKPFNYRKEQYTDLLWAMEGLTNYYALLLVARAKLMNAGEVRETLTQWISGYLKKPGRKVQSVAESSFDAWIKQYQRDEHTMNRTISYYEKGQLVGLVLDMEIRRRSQGRRSLDDVMRRLYKEFAMKGKGVVSGDFRRLAEEEAGGGNFHGLFRDYVQGTRALPVGEALSTVGLRLERPEGGQAYLGVSASVEGEKVVLHSVLAGSPAEEAGLSARDEIVAIDGIRATPEVWQRAVEDSRPEDSVRMSLFREGLLREERVRFGRAPSPPSKVVINTRASSRARRLHRSWISWPWKR